MQNLIRSIPDPLEILLVIGLAFGYSILSNIYYLFSVPVDGPPISSGHLMSLLIYETFTFVILWIFLSTRGWSLRTIGIEPNLKGIFVGVGIAAGTYALLSVVWLAVAILFPALHATARSSQLVGTGLPTYLIVAVSVLNPVYEELFVCGYLISSVEKMKNLTVAINVSVGIRLAYHLYQGPAALSIIPLGLVFAVYYAKTRRLWPVIIAHGMFDLIALITSTG